MSTVSCKEESMGTLDGRRALITGAGMGIGQGCAIALAREGAHVAVHYASSAAGARETVAQIEAAGGRAVAIGGDLSRVAEARRVVAEAVAALGGLEILINNSGVTRALDFAETSEAIYDEVFAINMKGIFFCTQQALPHLADAGRGAVLNMTSVHGFAGFPRHAAYAATKGAIIAFTRELAIELAPRKVRVNAIGPGLIEVPRYFDIPGYTTEQGDRMVPWGRVGTPADIGRAAAFLVSDAAEFITGQVLYVDGGTTARMGLWWDQGDRPQ
jgi:glucose 1-dehydrogenase/3-oxoacyl-[acyl-carrier protein] reductase